MDSIVLASASLRRQEYFRLLGLPFKIIPSSINEENVGNLTACDLAMSLAKKKVEATIKNLSGKAPQWIFAADTLISVDGQVFGKSKTREEAASVLKKLSGVEHEVITACALFNGRTNHIDCRSVSTFVTFAKISESCLEWYLETCEWQGAAGSYKIQGLAGCLITNIRGSYSNVVGLPLYEFSRMLIDNGYLHRK